ncbi:chorismate-binding protein, partial [Salmonella enterica subsp. enterica serovar Montevideo]|nr:chorismate-binding protein [Salmonella enterica subsp. enterica serovar Montevideo]
LKNNKQENNGFRLSVMDVDNNTPVKFNVKTDMGSIHLDNGAGLWHLGTPFEGKANAGENALTLACLLHPTPALSGFPHQVAKKL